MGIPIQTPMGATGGSGVFTAIDNSAELTAIASAIAAQTTAQVAQMERIQATLANLVAAVGAVADHTQGTSKSISDINSSIGAVATAMHDSAATQQIAAASTVKRNEFDIAVTKQGLAKNGEEVPPQPELKEQIKQSVKEGLEMHTATKASGFVSQKIEDAISDIKSWITSSGIYQDVTSWASKQKDTVLTAFGFKNPSTVARNAASAAGYNDPNGESVGS